MTFRSGKRHRTKESGRSTSVLKMAAKLQLFTMTGKASQSDLKAIDSRISSLMLDRIEKIRHLLDILKDSVPKTNLREFAKISEEWDKLLAEIVSKEMIGYAQVKTARSISGGMLDKVFDMDSELFNMLSAFNNALSDFITRASYEVPDLEMILRSTYEITTMFYSRQKSLTTMT